MASWLYTLWIKFKETLSPFGIYCIYFFNISFYLQGLDVDKVWNLSSISLYHKNRLIFWEKLLMKLDQRVNTIVQLHNTRNPFLSPVQPPKTGLLSCSERTWWSERERAGRSSLPTPFHRLRTNPFVCLSWFLSICTCVFACRTCSLIVSTQPLHLFVHEVNKERLPGQAPGWCSKRVSICWPHLQGCLGRILTLAQSPQQTLTYGTQPLPMHRTLF